MNHKKIIIPSVGISLTILSVFAVAMMGFIPHQGEGTGFLITSSDEDLAERAEIAVKGTVISQSTYLTYFNVGEMVFPKVYTLTELDVHLVTLGDFSLQGQVISIRTVGGTYNQVTTDFEPVSKFTVNQPVLVYLKAPVNDLLYGTYYQVQGIQTTFDLGNDGKYRKQLDDTVLDEDRIKPYLGLDTQQQND